MTEVVHRLSTSLLSLNEVSVLPTLKEQQELLINKQHTLMVWEVLYKFLDSTYIAKDGRTPEQAIRVIDCAKPIVDEDTLEEVLLTIEHDHIHGLRREIEEIENMDVLIVGEKDGREDA